MNEKKMKSITSFLNTFYPPSDFDEKKDEILERLSKKRGISREDILKEWEEKRKYALRIGEEIENEIGLHLIDKGDHSKMEWKPNRFHKFFTNIKQKKLQVDLELETNNIHLIGRADGLCLMEGGYDVLLEIKTIKNLTNLHEVKNLKEPFNKYKDFWWARYILQMIVYNLCIEFKEHAYPDYSVLWIIEKEPQTNTAEILQVMNTYLIDNSITYEEFVYNKKSMRIWFVSYSMKKLIFNFQMTRLMKQEIYK